MAHDPEFLGRLLLDALRESVSHEAVEIVLDIIAVPGLEIESREELAEEVRSRLDEMRQEVFTTFERMANNALRTLGGGEEDSTN